MTTEPPHSGPPPGIATSAPSRTPLWRGLLGGSHSHAIPSCRPKRFLPLDGRAHQVAPLCPGAVVVAHLVVAEEVVEYEPSVGRTLPDAAVGNDVVALVEICLALVDLAQLIGALEGPVLTHGPRPRHVRRPRDVPAPQGPLLRVVRHVQELARVLAGAPHVHEGFVGLYVLLHVLLERPYLGVVAGRDRIIGARERRNLLGHRPSLGLPLNAPSVHYLDVVVPEEPEDPQSIRSPPVVPVAVEDYRRVRAYALLAHQVREALGIQIITHQGIVQILDPVDLDRVRDVPDVVEEHVLVGLHDAYVLGVLEVLRDPFGRHQRLRMRVVLLLYRLLRHPSLLSSALVNRTGAHFKL